jgi:DNA-binding response OmpR family regulator
VTTRIEDLLATIDVADLLAELRRRGAHVDRDEHGLAVSLSAPTVSALKLGWHRETIREMRSRAEQDRAAVVELPGLRVDPLSFAVVWRCRVVSLSARESQVLYALALAHRDGAVGLTGRALAGRVWRGWTAVEGIANARVCISTIRHKLPGLIVLAGAGRNPVTYALAPEALGGEAVA